MLAFSLLTLGVSTPSASAASIVTAIPQKVTIVRQFGDRSRVNGQEVFQGSMFHVDFKVTHVVKGRFTHKAVTTNIPAVGLPYFDNAKFFLVLDARGAVMTYGKVQEVICIDQKDALKFSLIKYLDDNEQPTLASDVGRCLVLENVRLQRVRD